MGGELEEKKEDGKKKGTSMERGRDGGKHKEEVNYGLIYNQEHLINKKKKTQLQQLYK